MKIGICGKMCSGKSTLAKKIIEYYYNDEYVKDSFAGKIYEIAHDVFNMKDKNRVLLQQIGTKMRDINKDVWINFIIKLNISSNVQEQRIRKLYKNTYNHHLNNRKHDSEINIDIIPDDKFNMIVQVDNKSIDDIIKEVIIALQKYNLHS